MKRKTMGAVATDLLNKAPESNTVIDIQREAQKEYIENLEWAVRHAKKEVDCSHLIGGGRGHEDCATREPLMGDFYVVVITKKEKLLQNVLRNQFFTTISCPTPDYNQSVFKYHDKTGDLEYLWTVPDEESCAVYYENAAIVVPEERQLLGFVLDFLNGALLQKARRLNGEISTGIILEGK
jgi:hypothetical protein